MTLRHRWLALAGTALPALVPGCRRDADLLEDLDAAVVPTSTAPYPAGGIPPVPDAGLPDEAQPLCGERQEGDCRGANDFPCAFDRALNRLVTECRREANCTASGWLSVSLDDEGCPVAVGMETPHDDFLHCLVGALAPLRCPCEAKTYERWIGPPGLRACGSDGGVKG